MSAEHLNSVPYYYRRAITRLDAEVIQINFVSPNKITPFAQEKMRLADQVRTEFDLPPEYPEAHTHLPTDHH